MDQSHVLERSLKAYGWYAVFMRAYFWTPLFVLYFSTIVTLKEIFLLEAIYYASVFVLEVPSGYFSDFFGRRRTLLISTISFCVSYILFFVGGSFLVFAVAQFFLAIGFSFASGTDTSLHYALLSSLGRENEYGQREARLSSLGLISVASAAVLGGLFAWLDEYRIAYGLSGLFSSVSLLLVIYMKDPEAQSAKENEPIHPFVQLKNVFSKLKDPSLKYLFVFTILITVLNHIPYELYQIYINRMLMSANINAKITAMSPLVLGVHTAISMIIASIFAHRAISIGTRIGKKTTLITLILLQTIMIGIMGIHANLSVVLLLMLRGLPGAISAPIVRSQTTYKLPSTLRATFYSTQSLLGRISFAMILVVFNLIPGNGFENSIITGAFAGLIFFILMLGLKMRN